MTAIVSEVFLATVANALERMAFVVVEPAGCDAAEVLAASSCCASIGLQHDDGAGAVLVAATDGFLREFIAGMLGQEAEAIDLGEYGEVAVMELANVLGGEAVMAVGGCESPLRLDLPKAITTGAAAALLARITAAAGHFACTLQSECGRIMIAGCLG